MTAPRGAYVIEKVVDVGPIPGAPRRPPEPDRPLGRCRICGDVRRLGIDHGCEDCTRSRLSAIERSVIVHPSNSRHARRRAWIADEDDIVRREFDGTAERSQAIAERLKRSFYAIKDRAQTLGLTRRKEPDWTEAECAYLEKWLDKVPVAVIAKHLQRSETAVKVKAARLDLSRRSRDGWYTKSEACTILGVDHKWLQRRIDLGELKATWHHGHEPGKLNGMAAWHIEAKDLKQWIQRHAGALTGRNVDMLLMVDLLAGVLYEDSPKKAR